MASTHVLWRDSADSNNYFCVGHVAMPTGNNLAGATWKVAYLATLLGSAPATMLPIGNSTGQIGQQEANQVASGDVIEFTFIVTDDPSYTAAQRNANIDATYTQVKNAKLAELQAKLTYVGYTRA